MDDFMSLLYDLWYYRLMPAMIETPNKSEDKSIEELIKETNSYRYESKED